MRLHASFLLFFLLGIELALDLRQSVLASIPRDFHGPCHSDWSSKSAATAAAYASTHFSNDFQCLSDSTPYTSQILDSGQCRGYHWTLSNFSAIRNSVDQRHFTILLSPCHGNPSLYARPLMGFPSSKEGDFWYSANQTRVHFNHTRGTTNELRLPMQWSDVFISGECVTVRNNAQPWPRALDSKEGGLTLLASFTINSLQLPARMVQLHDLNPPK